MTSKDWILLIVPIILNGMIIFIIQKSLSIKFEKKIRNQISTSKTIGEFQDTIKESVYLLSKLRYNAKSNEINNIINEFFNKITTQLLPSYYLHKKVLCLLEKDICELEAQSNELIEAIKTDNLKKANIYINKIHDILLEISNQCDRIL